MELWSVDSIVNLLIINQFRLLIFYFDDHA